MSLWNSSRLAENPWQLVWGQPYIDSDTLAAALEGDLQRNPCPDYRTRLLIRDARRPQIEANWQFIYQEPLSSASAAVEAKRSPKKGKKRGRKEGGSGNASGDVPGRTP